MWLKRFHSLPHGLNPSDLWAVPLCACRGRVGAANEGVEFVQLWVALDMRLRIRIFSRELRPKAVLQSIKLNN